MAHDDDGEEDGGGVSVFLFGVLVLLVLGSFFALSGWFFGGCFGPRGGGDVGG